MTKTIYPIMTLRGLVVYPGITMTFDVGRTKSIKAIESSLRKGKSIYLLTQKDPETEDPVKDELYRIGTVCTIKNVLPFSEDRIRVVVEGVSRAELLQITHDTEYLRGTAKILDTDRREDGVEEKRVFKKIIDALDAYMRLNRRLTADFKLFANKYENNLRGLIYETANTMPCDFKLKQRIMEKDDIKEAGKLLLDYIFHEMDVINFEREIQEKVQANIGRLQKESYLREQLKVIRSELGEDENDNDLEEYKEKAEALKNNDEVYQKVVKEINRLSKMPFGYAEASVITSYLDVLFALPWNTQSQENIDLKYASEVLEEEHYGLEKVKERILEYLAVRKMIGSMKGPILCLVGPPGVGKTSIAKSIARSLNKKYVRMSLGGVKDESEIRGHRKTYVGAMPGRIINSIKQAGTNNPLILLDEIDKMGNDFKGDPTSAMLEVLDSEQNFSFRDHYLELPFDLSKVLFMCTANSLETIPAPLRDRMEIIEVSSYTEEEKQQIALKYLLPKQIEEHGLSAKTVRVEDDAMAEIIKGYTAEAGVRGLEREIARMCRRIAKLFAEGKRKTYKVRINNIESLLGAKKRFSNKIREKDEIGVCTGLAWTSIGGVILNIEVNVMPGTGRLQLTGHLGEVMKESAAAAMSYIRSRMNEFGLEEDFYSKYDIHIHIPEGATPKDGPSAGITLATAMISALIKIPCRKNVAMTGEITLRGRILPIGGFKEKSLAAYRAGIKTVVMPEDNIKDLEEIPENIRKQIKFVPVNNMDEVFKAALLDYKGELYCDIMNIDNPKGGYAYEHI